MLVHSHAENPDAPQRAPSTQSGIHSLRLSAVSTDRDRLYGSAFFVPPLEGLAEAHLHRVALRRLRDPRAVPIR
jgi:hypothetical protein